MTDGDELLWTYRPQPAKPRSGELLFSLRRDGHEIRCELRYHGEHGVEAMFLRDSELFTARTFTTRALAAQWAELERAAHEREGWTTE